MDDGVVLLFVWFGAPASNFLNQNVVEFIRLSICSIPTFQTEHAHNFCSLFRMENRITA